MATYDLTSSVPSASNIQTGDILNCPYSGNSVSVTLPVGTFILECWGAQGGSSGSNSNNSGGKGGYSTGILTLTEPTIIYLYAGGEGTAGSSTSSIKAGGWNGGGNSGYYRSGAGGGASDIRIGQDSLYARVIVAGGGGGNGYNGVRGNAGGVGGGIPAGDGDGASGATGQGGNLTTPGAGGNSSGSNGAFGIGGNAASTENKNNRTGGGGSGWMGGGGGGYLSGGNGGGGGGGSGYVYTSSLAVQFCPEGWLLTNAYYLGSAATGDGATSFTDYDGSTVTGHSGNGAIRITVQTAYTQVPIPTLGNKTYNGSSQSPTETNYNSTYMTKSGDTSATLPGTYIITYTLKTTGDYIWSDGTFEPKDITWQITSTWKEAQAWVYDT